MQREAYWRLAKETEANVNSSEYALFTQSNAWSVKIKGIFVILMGGNPKEPCGSKESLEQIRGGY